jgi:hypothetical protein
MNRQESAHAEGAREVHRGWIVLFAVLEFLIGAILVLMTVGMMVLALSSQGILKTPMAGRGGLALVFPILFYSAAALLFLFAGAGTLARCGWARILMLVVSWFWLVLGILGGITVLVTVPLILGQAARGGQVGSREITTLVWIFGVATILFSVVLPGSFLVFYTRRSVKAAFEKREAEEDSRQKLPLLVAIFAIWSGFCALGRLCSIPYGLFVLFGFFITGAPAIILSLISSGLYGFLAWRIVRLERKVWWAAFLFHLLLGISAVITFFRIPMNKFFAALGASQIVDPAQRQVMLVVQSYLPCFTLIWQVLLLGFILYVKRYFRPYTDITEPQAIP